MKIQVQDLPLGRLASRLSKCIFLAFSLAFSLSVIVGDRVGYGKSSTFMANADIEPEDDPCSNDIGNGNELIFGPSGPSDADLDHVFRALAVDPLNANIVFVGTERNGIFKSDDGGTSWQWLRYGIRHSDVGYPEVWDITISPSGSSQALLAATLDSPGPVTGDYPSSVGGVYKSTDGGETWVRSNCGLENSRAVSILFDPNNENVLVLGIEGGEATFSQLEGQYFDGGLFKSMDGGATWNPLDLPSGSTTNGYWHLRARDSDPSHFFTFGFNFDDLSANLGFLQSLDNGNTWNTFGSELENLLIHSFDISHEGTVIYANERDSFEVRKSMDGGESWITLSAPANGIIKVSPADSSLILFDNNGDVYKSVDGLNSSSLVLSAADRIEDIEFAPSNPDIIYAAEMGYNIYKSTDAGSTFTLMVNLRADVMESEEDLIIDIKANGSDEPVTLSRGNNLIITISLDPGSYDGDDADWWVYATSPFGEYWYTLDGGWVRSDTPILLDDDPLFSLSPSTILATSTLPVGDYTFSFALDNRRDGVFAATYVDSVSATIQRNSG